MGTVRDVVPTPTSLPDPGPSDLSERTEPYRWEGIDVNAHIRTGVDTCFGPSWIPLHSPPLPTSPHG